MSRAGRTVTLPVSLGALAVASWVGLSGTEEPTLLKRLLPGGSATELVPNAWNGGVPVPESPPLLLPTLARVVVAVAHEQNVVGVGVGGGGGLPSGARGLAGARRGGVPARHR
ncbi:hypothetical protein AB0I16_35170 [Streptomyces sp. NPDC050703]|uniref:hypothetical protein n=1 Tax=Streptomyces sp. NPDC050703 TaxID=3157218 RepID=UPI003437FB08